MTDSSRRTALAAVFLKDRRGLAPRVLHEGGTR